MIDPKEHKKTSNLNNNKILVEKMEINNDVYQEDVYMTKQWKVQTSTGTSNVITSFHLHNITIVFSNYTEIPCS